MSDQDLVKDSQEEMCAVRGDVLIARAQVVLSARRFVEGLVTLNELRGALRVLDLVARRARNATNTLTS